MATVLAVVYLLAWPVPIEPVAWQAPPAPAFPADAAPLSPVEWLGTGDALGPEATAFDAAGRVHTGTSDGRILQLDPASGKFTTLAATGGRPLGMVFDDAGTLYVCDAKRGLLALSREGTLRVLATEHGGVRFGLTDDVDRAPDGTLFFTDASSRFGVGQEREAILEHGGDGRLLAYHPHRGTVELLRDGLQFANGVAVAGDGSYLLVSETGAYRVTRVWLRGPRRGSSEVFIDNLPGLPDNVTWSPARRVFWIALFSPRIPALDHLAPFPFVRKVVFRLPRTLQPEPARHAAALAVDEQGRVVESLRDVEAGAYAPVTSVREHGGFLWLGSLQREALGRVAAPPPR